MVGQLKEGNERPVHITLSHDDVMRLKGAVSEYAKWHGTDYGKLTRVYMVLDAAIGAAGYYPEEQPQLYGLSLESQERMTAQRLERLRKELSGLACQYEVAGQDNCPTRGVPDTIWCTPCRVRKHLEEN